MNPITKLLLTVAILSTVPLSATHAQSMPGAERQEMIANFLEADTNNDGLLYRSEFELLMRLNAEDNLGRAEMVVRTGAYGRAFGLIDGNGDGAISRQELQELAEERG